MLVHETRSLQIFFDDRGSADIIICFNELSFRPDGMSYWGKPLVERLGLSAIGIVTKERNWFPSSEIDVVKRRVNDISSNFSCRIGYGCSMGGYAAIKHSKSLNLTYVVSVSPQCSINPQDVGLFDRRYKKYYIPDIHQNMVITNQDLGGSIYIVHDPNFRADRMHARKITELGGRGLPIPAFNTDHATIRCLANSAAMQSIFHACLHKDIDIIQNVVADRRRQSAIRCLVLARRAVKRNIQLACSILDVFFARFSDQAVGLAEQADLLGELGHHLLTAGRESAAEAAFRHSLKLRRHHLKSFIGMAKIALQRNDLSVASEFADRLYRVSNRSSGMEKALAEYHNMCVKAGLIDEVPPL